MQRGFLKDRQYFVPVCQSLPSERLVNPSVLLLITTTTKQQMNAYEQHQTMVVKNMLRRPRRCQRSFTESRQKALSIKSYKNFQLHPLVTTTAH
ncbi:hypothetical protein T12_12864 [Trichinella patagoniensis]|uniref:Uncharacterized protein n=1 Tax=Trichinella patagoniensis TaxID=990121 RepID=A0A0V0ZZL8_9BILA|nr:hypothetical protein T09_2574 [Trichinella sp. T9]KRY18118.1 hypothetical protein T12_12864 [Trichinella patagoniensis]